MRSITQQMKFIQQSKKIGLMTHVVAGYPTLQETIKLVIAMERAGVDIVEVQIPFSDPIADGPTIMKANDTALANNVTIQDTLLLIQQLSKQVHIPLLLMGYYNSLIHYEVKQFCQDAQQAGAQGLIIPDIPIDEEEYEHFLQYCSLYHLAPIRVLSPTSTDERIQANLKVAKGFLYCTAISGTTGTRSTVDRQTQQFLRKMKQLTNIPLAVGFGISDPSHVKDLIGFADIAVVGSAVIQQIEKSGIQGVEEYLEKFVEVGRK